MTNGSVYIAAGFTVKSERIATEENMSARNGDKSRHQINRKRGVHRRTKNRELLKSLKAQSAPPAKPEK